MKKKIFNPIAALLFIIIIFPGCFKDHITHTYTLQTPVYKTLSAIRADMKAGPAVSLNNTGKIYIQGNYIFLSERERGIHIIDNSNPSNPRNISFIDIPGNEDIAVKDQILYADSYGDMITFDISDPAHVNVKKILENVFPERSNYTPGTNPDSILLVVDWISKDTTIDASSPPPNIYFMRNCSNCAFLAAANVPAASGGDKGIGGSMARFTVISNYLYTVSTSKLNVFNISNAADPSFTNSSQLSWPAETIYPFENRLFIGTNNGVFIFNVESDPSNPKPSGQFAHTRACDPVIADEHYAFVTLSDGTKCQGYENQLDIIDVRQMDFSVFSLVKSYQFKHPLGLSKDGNTLFICDDKDGLKIFDATDVMDLKMISNQKHTETFDVIAVNGLAIVVGNDGLYQYDYSDLNNIHLLSKLSSSVSN